jgi:hypothetical protein
LGLVASTIRELIRQAKAAKIWDLSKSQNKVLNNEEVRRLIARGFFLNVAGSCNDNSDADIGFWNEYV